MSLDGTELKTTLLEIQTLAKLYGDQFQVIRTTVTEMNVANEKQHRLVIEQMEALKVALEAVTELVARLDQISDNLQQVTVALINIVDQEQQEAEASEPLART